MPTLKTLAAAEGRVGGYLVLWGSPQQRDLQGEYFTSSTDLGLDWYDCRPVLYHHGLDGTLKAAVIGVIDTLRPNDTGLWAEAQLDLRHRYVRAVQRLIDKGILGWSSGSLPHLVQVEHDGEIKRWPIVEGSLTPSPAEPRRTDVHTLKSAYAALGLDAARLLPSPDPDPPAESDPVFFSPPSGVGEGPGVGGASLHPSSLIPHNSSLMTKGAAPMSDPMNITVPLPTTTDDRAPRKRLPIAAEADATKAAPHSITVASPFDRLDALDLLHGYMLLRAAKTFHGVTEQFANALAHKVNRAGLSALKLNELSYSTQAAFGDEWVPDLWSAQIWQKARLDNVILPLFQQIEMPSNPFELPLESTDPTVYFVPETADEAHLTLGSGNPIPDSKVGSGKVQLVAKKLALRVGFSSDLVEDSVIPVLNIYREQATRAIADSIDYFLLNGDTTTAGTGNINSDNGAPAATDRYLAFNGLRKLPLVTTTANSTDAVNAAPTLALLRSTRFKLPARYSARPADLAWIVDD